MTLEIGKSYYYRYNGDKWINKNFPITITGHYNNQHFIGSDSKREAKFLFDCDGNCLGILDVDTYNYPFHLVEKEKYQFKVIYSDGSVSSVWYNYSKDIVSYYKDSSKFLIRYGEDNTTIELLSAEEFRNLV